MMRLNPGAFAERNRNILRFEGQAASS
jgi:hypothetical protein